MTAATESMTSATAPAPIDRDAMIRDELLAALPHLRRLPDRIDRILTLTSRGELRVRSIVDEDARRILRTLVNRALLVAAGAAFLVVAAVLLVAADPGPDRRWRHRAVRGLRLLRSARRHGAPAPRRRGRHPGRDDMTARRQPRRSSHRLDVGRPRRAATSRPPGERYFRHPGDVVRAGPRWRRRCCSWCCSSRSPPRTSAGCERGPRPGRRRGARRAARAPARGSRRSSRSSCPVLVVVALVYRRRWRRLGVVVLAAGAGAAAVRAARRWRSTSAARVPDAVTGGTWMASTDFPSLTYVAGAAAVVDRREAVALAVVAAVRRC